MKHKNKKHQKYQRKGQVSSLLPSIYRHRQWGALTLIFLLVAVVGGIAWYSSTRAANTTVFRLTPDFDGSTASAFTSQQGIQGYQASSSGRIATVTSVAGAKPPDTSRAVRFLTRYPTDNGVPNNCCPWSDRTELRISDAASGYQNGKTYWFGWQVYVPTPWPRTPAGKYADITQFHASAGSGSPPVAFNLNENNQLLLELRKGTYMNSSRRAHNLGAFPFNQWITFKMRITWSPNDGPADLEMWMHTKNGGFKHVQDSGANTYSDYPSGYLKFGIYRGSLNPNTDEATIYHANWIVAQTEDEIKATQGSVYGGGETTPPPPPTPSNQIDQTGNLATGATVTSSSQASTNYLPTKVIDGEEVDNSSRWISAPSDPQWLQVDLGTSRSIGKVSILWDGTTTRDYRVEVSTDGTTFSKVADGAVDNLASVLRSHQVNNNVARYIRITGTGRWNDNFGHSIRELGIYAGTAVPQSGDVDGNGAVNGLDLSKVLTNYGKTEQPRTEGDLDGNGAVNGLDLSQVLSNYGK